MTRLRGCWLVAGHLGEGLLSQYAVAAGQEHAAEREHIVDAGDEAAAAVGEPRRA
jgi:hypothetical protein